MISTLGHWEEQRKVLVKDLIALNDVTLTESKINTALFGPVHRAMFEEAMEFLKKPMPISLRDKIYGSFKVSLNVVLKHLSIALNISEERLKPAVQKFCAAALVALDALIDDMGSIAEWSRASEYKILAQLYGANFKTRFPDLARGLPSQDKELAGMAYDDLVKTASSVNFGSNTAAIQEHLKYIKQIIMLAGISEEFKTHFQHETGHSMSDYKKAIPSTFTSYGLWEEIRRAFVKDLMTEPLVEEKITKEQIDFVLLGKIMRDLLEEFASLNRAWAEGEVAPQNGRSLEKILPSLSRTLGIAEYVLKPHVDKFVMEYKKIIGNELRQFNDKISIIAPEILEDAITILYGDDFNKKYPEIAPIVCEKDPDLQQLVTELLGKKIRRDMPKQLKTAARWKQQLVFMNECAAQQEYSFGFSETLKKSITSVLGMPLEVFKENVANKNKKDIYFNLGAFPSPVLERRNSYQGVDLTSPQNSF